MGAEQLIVGAAVVGRPRTGPGRRWQPANWGGHLVNIVSNVGCYRRWTNRTLKRSGSWIDHGRAGNAIAGFRLGPAVNGPAAAGGSIHGTLVRYDGIDGWRQLEGEKGFVIAIGGILTHNDRIAGAIGNFADCSRVALELGYGSQWKKSSSLIIHAPVDAVNAQGARRPSRFVAHARDRVNVRVRNWHVGGLAITARVRLQTFRAGAQERLNLQLGSDLVLRCIGRIVVGELLVIHLVRTFLLHVGQNVQEEGLLVVKLLRHISGIDALARRG